MRVTMNMFNASVAYLQITECSYVAKYANDQVPRIVQHRSRAFVILINE